MTVLWEPESALNSACGVHGSRGLTRARAESIKPPPIPPTAAKGDRHYYPSLKQVQLFVAPIGSDEASSVAKLNKFRAAGHVLLDQLQTGA